MRIQKMLILALTTASLLCTPVFADESTTQVNNQGSSANLSDQNKLVGQAFLAKNMTQPGVVTLPDGLQYRVIKQGQGPKPTANSTVTVNYAGRLVNGKEFDSSYKRGEPTSFPVNGVIPGWVEALQRMNKGAVWELYVPAQLAYGEKGVPPTIGPNETLIFKIELLDVK